MHVSYRINSRDEITFVNDRWSQFASINNASNLVGDNVLCRSLWDFISDGTVIYLYQKILDRVKAGHSLKFNVRCDSPKERRLTEMKITPQKDGEVQFDNRIIWTQSRMPAIIFNNKPPTDNLLIICSWCNKIETGNGKWQEVEEAVKTLGLFDLETLPTISHGMCGSCYKTVSSMLKELKPA